MLHTRSLAPLARAHQKTTELTRPLACIRKFLRFFPGGFTDSTYLAWERNYKWEAHRRWTQALSRSELEALSEAGNHLEIARRAVRIESGTNLLFSFEKMALRDAVRTPAAARFFAHGLEDLLAGHDSLPVRFERWCETLAALPRKQTRVLTWPLATVFGFLAQPARHFFVKPLVTRSAAEQYGFELPYRSRPNWETYSKFLDLARTVRRDLNDLQQENLRPRDMIDIQSFLWVQGSHEYD